VRQELDQSFLNNNAAFNESADDPPMIKRKHRPESGKSLTKLFVLDTNVLMHDPTSLFRFEEHDVFLPIMTLEELDGHKKGLSEVARNARQASRYLDEIVSSVARQDRHGHPAQAPQGGFRDWQAVPADPGAGQRAARVACPGQGRQSHYRRGHGPCSGSSRNGRSSWCPKTSTCASRRVRSDWPPRTTSTTRCWRTSTCSTPRVRELPADFWDLHAKDMESWKKEGHTYYRVKGPPVPAPAGQ